MSAIRRIQEGASAAWKDTQARHEYSARLKWLLRGSGSLPAWSLEYRAGLQGIFAVNSPRSGGTDTFTRKCPDDCQTHAPLAHLYESRFTYRLSDTVVNTVTGASLLCSTPEPPFFIRESISWPFESILTHGLDIPEIKQAVAGPAEPTTVFPGTRNYYHWLIEELPLVVRALAAEPAVRVLANAESITPRHLAVASSLGFDIKPSAKTVRLPQHVLPGRASDSWFIHPEDAKILLDLGERVASPTSTTQDRIYVSRRGAKRSLQGEDVLEDLLQSDGFTVIHPENLEWVDQIAIFRSAKVVVGPHGAGLSNLAFTPPGTLLVEITDGRHYNRCFEWLCHIAGHAYSPISGNDGSHLTPHQIHASIVNAIS